MAIKRARILVIDDEKVIRDSCTRIFSSEGYEVRSAENGDRGLELFREFHPDLVLVDLKMPGKSGTEVLKDIEKVEPNVVKIVITGYATVSSAVDSMKKGAYDFIPKPYTPDEILLIVSRGLERRRLLLEAEVLRAEREKTRGNMISLVSHELRSPLAAAVQYLDVILGGMAGEVSSDAREMIHRCNMRLRELLDLMSRWLSLATFDPIRIAEHFEDIDLNDVAGESLDALRSLAEEKNMSLALEVPPGLPPIKGSRVLLEEIFTNLISNAIKYNREGGWVKVSLKQKDQQVQLGISDNGIGIEEKHLARLFDEFYRVDGRRTAPVKGWGLGLSIVKRMVEAHGGRIDVKSSFGEGTTFTVTFPMITESQRET
jgi:two-component system sensor histidine kinase/response regulator